MQEYQYIFMRYQKIISIFSNKRL